MWRAIQARQQGWFAAVLVLAVLVQLPTFAARPAASYRALELGASGAELGAVVAAYAVLSLVCAVPVGWCVDRWGERPFLVVGAVLVAASAFALGRVGSLPTLAVALALLGLGHLIATVGMQTLVAKRSGSRKAAAYFGYFTVAVSLGQLAGPLLLSLLAGGGPAELPQTGQAAGIPQVHTGPVFAAAGAFGLGAVVCALVPASSRTRDAPRDQADGDARQPSIGRAGLHVLQLPNMPQAMLVSFGVIASVDVLVAYLPAYGESAGLSARTVGFLLATRAAAALASRLFMGFAVRRVGLAQLLFASTASSAAALGLVPLMQGIVPLLLALMAVAGLGLGLGQPLTLAWVARTVPTQIKSTAIAVRLTGNRAGQVTVPAAVGALTGWVGPGAMFVVLAVLLTASALASVRGPNSYE
ncbi:MAG: MFS transporter [Carbonactinosporaceae bacterium]